jgi:drug/metabolite transporter (DMT)-like permease
MTSAAAAILLQFTAPVFIILIQLVFYKLKPKISEITAVAVTVSGMMLFFAGNLDSGELLGNILAILSGLSFAGVFVCNKKPDAKPEQALLLGFVINAVIGLPFIFFGAGGVTAEPAAWVAVIFLGVVQVGFAYIFFSAGIKKTPALLACLITAMEPVLNPVWVALATDEVPGAFAITGGVIIILTIVIYNIWVEKNRLKNG